MTLSRRDEVTCQNVSTSRESCQVRGGKALGPLNPSHSQVCQKKGYPKISFKRMDIKLTPQFMKGQEPDEGPLMQDDLSQRSEAGASPEFEDR